MDCDRAMLLIARRSERTLTGKESARLGNHIDTCAACTELAVESDVKDWVWIARVPQDALDDPDLLTLPTVDPALFDVEGPIASGGMGRILKARDRRLGRTIAIKEVLDDGLLDRFEREAMVTARLQHPAIVPIYEAGKWIGGSAFYTMRLVSGETLGDAINARESLAERLALLPNLIAVTEALAYAHSEGVVHRDLKPGNILVGDFGETVVIDWGIAKVLGEPEEGTADDPADGTASLLSRELTGAGQVLGTPCYIAPEQAVGRPADPRSDVYSLGVILYTLLAKGLPYLDEYPDASATSLLDLVVRREPTRIAERAPDAPSELHAICERAMARDPARRFPTAKEMAVELRKFEAGQLIASKVYTLRDLLWRWLTRHRAVVLVSAAAAIILAIVAGVAVLGVARSRDVAEAARDRTRVALAQSQERADDLVFRQAQGSLAGDPTRTVAWLKQYPADGRRAGGAALLAAEAIRLGVHAHAFDARGQDPTRLELVDGDTMLLATTGLGHAARVWDLETGAAHDLRALTREQVFFDDETREFFGPSKRCLPIRFETVNGSSRSLGRGRDDSTRCAFVSEAARRLVAIGLDAGHIIVWSGEGEAFSEFGARGSPIAFFANGSRLLGFGPSFETIEVWEVPSGHRFASVATPDDIVSTDPEDFGAVSPVARVAAILLDSGVRLWWYDSGATETIAAGETVGAMTLAADGQQIAVGLESGWVEVFDAATAKSRCRWRADFTAVTAIAYADATTLVVGTGSGDVVLAAACGKLERRLRGHTRPVTHIVVSGDGGLVASASTDQSVRVHRRSRGASSTSHMTTTSTTVPTECRTPDNVYVHGDTSWFHCIDEGADTLIASRPDGQVTVPVSTSWHVSGDGSTVATTHEGAVTVWRRGESKRLKIASGAAARLSFDGRTLFAATGESLEKWDVERAERSETLRHRVSFAAPSPDGTALAVDGPDGIGVLDRAGDIRGVVHLDGHGQVRWSRDSGLVGFQTGDGAIAVFDRTARTWTRLTSDRPVVAFAISNAGRLVSASTDDGRELILWDIDTGARHEVGLASKYDGAGVSISRDGRRVSVHALPRSATVNVPDFSPARLAAATRAVIDEQGEARTPAAK